MALEVSAEGIKILILYSSLQLRVAKAVRSERQTETLIRHVR